MWREITKLNKSWRGEGRDRVILYTNKPERGREVCPASQRGFSLTSWLLNDCNSSSLCAGQWLVVAQYQSQNYQFASTKLRAGQRGVVTVRGGTVFLLADYQAVTVIRKTFHPAVMVSTLQYIYVVSQQNTRCNRQLAIVLRVCCWLQLKNFLSLLVMALMFSSNHFTPDQSWESLF